MKFAVLLALAATALAAPSMPATNSPPPTHGECIKYTPGAEPGTWTALPCPAFTFPPGSTCKKVPGKKGAPYPKCCPKPYCPDDE